VALTWHAKYSKSKNANSELVTVELMKSYWTSVYKYCSAQNFHVDRDQLLLLSE